MLSGSDSFDRSISGRGQDAERFRVRRRPEEAGRQVGQDQRLQR
jgi:hypothetical protein